MRASPEWAIHMAPNNAELKLEYSVETLKIQLRQRGYFRCIACQKPYLTAAQALAQFL
jgi:hypothetical protein